MASIRSISDGGGDNYIERIGFEESQSLITAQEPPFPDSMPFSSIDVAQSSKINVVVGWLSLGSMLELLLTLCSKIEPSLGNVLAGSTHLICLNIMFIKAALK